MESGLLTLICHSLDVKLRSKYGRHVTDLAAEIVRIGAEILSRSSVLIGAKKKLKRRRAK